MEHDQHYQTLPRPLAIRRRFLNDCGGGCRVRAVLVHGNLWAPDPACQVTDEENSTVALPA